jgi:hypothetical protein
MPNGMQATQQSTAAGGGHCSHWMLLYCLLAQGVGWKGGKKKEKKEKKGKERKK